MAPVDSAELPMAIEFAWCAAADLPIAYAFCAAAEACPPRATESSPVELAEFPIAIEPESFAVLAPNSY